MDTLRLWREREALEREQDQFQMTITARITLEGDELKAALSDGPAIFATDPRVLAGLLVAAGVAVDHAHCADWREGDMAPTAGQAIALKSAMRIKQGS